MFEALIIIILKVGVIKHSVEFWTMADCKRFAKETEAKKIVNGKSYQMTITCLRKDFGEDSEAVAGE